MSGPLEVDPSTAGATGGGDHGWKSPVVRTIYRRSWRLDDWPEAVPSRQGWQVECSQHGLLGRPVGYAYATIGAARSVVTKHYLSHARQQ